MHKPLTDTRPAYVEEWLENLPYTDFAKTTHLLVETLRYCNQQGLKSSTRFELLDLYLHPYEYLLETWVKNAENSSSLESRYQFIQPMKFITAELLACCRQALNDSLMQKTRWINTKPPTQGILIGIRLVSHLLLMHYQAYTPVPKPVWRELHELYLSADSLRQLAVDVPYPVGDVPVKTNVDHVYKQILATSLVDPHHLPFGAIWEIYDQLDIWADGITISDYAPPTDTSGLYMVDINLGTVPYSLSKFKVKQEKAGLKIIDCRALQKHVQQAQQALDKDGKLPGTVAFSEVHAQTLVTQLRHAYGTPVKRVHPRTELEGGLRVASGVNALYFHLNNETEFSAETTEDTDEIMGVDNVFASDTQPRARYETEDWSFINQSSGGFSIFKNEKPGTPPRIGDLIGIYRSTNGLEDTWLMGTVRWLMVQKNGEYKIGIQSLAVNPQAVAVRAVSGGKTDTDFRRAFLFSAEQGSDYLVVPRGLFMKDRSLELKRSGETLQIMADELQESTVAYEQFSWKN